MLRGIKGAFGGDEDQRRRGSGARSALVFLLGLGQLPAAALAAQPRPDHAAVADGVALVLQPRRTSSRRCRSSIPRSSGSCCAASGSAFTGRGSRSRALWPTWVLLAAHRLSRGIPHRPQRRVVERHRRRLLGRHRRGADRLRGRGSVGPLPRRGIARPPAGRPTPPARSATTCRRTAAASRRTRRATRTARLRTRRTSPATSVAAGAGSGTTLPAVHFTSILFDVLTMLGLWLVGRRFGGARLAAVLAFAWAAYPFTQYASSSNTNDTIMPCLLVYGFWLASSPVGRGVFGALSGWSKFATLVVAPLWATYPDRRPSWRFLAAFAIATLAAFSVVLLEPSPLHELRVFWDRTVRGRSAAHRRSRSGTGGSTTHAACPTSTCCSACSQGAARRRRDRGRVRSRAVSRRCSSRRSPPRSLPASSSCRRTGSTRTSRGSSRSRPSRFRPRRLRRAPARVEEMDYTAGPSCLRPANRDAEQLDRARRGRASVQSTTTPSMRTPPCAGAKRTGSRVRIRRMASVGLDADDGVVRARSCRRR